MKVLRTIRGRISKAKAAASTNVLVSVVTGVALLFGFDLTQEQAVGIATVLSSLIGLAQLFTYERIDQEATPGHRTSSNDALGLGSRR